MGLKKKVMLSEKKVRGVKRKAKLVEVKQTFSGFRGQTVFNMKENKIKDKPKLVKMQNKKTTEIISKKVATADGSKNDKVEVFDLSNFSSDELKEKVSSGKAGKEATQNSSSINLQTNSSAKKSNAKSKNKKAGSSGEIVTVQSITEDIVKPSNLEAAKSDSTTKKQVQGNNKFASQSQMKRKGDEAKIVSKKLKEDIPDYYEIVDGLHLWIRYFKSNASLVKKTLKDLNGLHSVKIMPNLKPDDSLCEEILLFTDVESLVKGKLTLDGSSAVKAVDFMGIASKDHKTAYHEKNCKFVLQFNWKPKKKSIKLLDKGIVSIKLLSFDKDTKQTEFLLEFSDNRNEVNLTRFMGKLKGLEAVKTHVSFTELQDSFISKQDKLLVLRDVPKTASLDDIKSAIPEIQDASIFKETFPASKYCHAILQFRNAKSARRRQSSDDDLKVLDKEVFITPFHFSFAQNLPTLGETLDTETKDDVEDHDSEVVDKDVASEKNSDGSGEGSDSEDVESSDNDDE